MSWVTHTHTCTAHTPHTHHTAFLGPNTFQFKLLKYVCICVYIICIYVYFLFFLAVLCSMQDPSLLTRDQTHEALQWKYGVLTIGRSGNSQDMSCYMLHFRHGVWVIWLLDSHRGVEFCDWNSGSPDSIAHTHKRNEKNLTKSSYSKWQVGALKELGLRPTHVD